MNHKLPSTLHALQRFGSILVAGPDARSFLQGQLSFDMSQLTSGRIELASCNSPQGRVQAVAWLLERSDGLALILPAELVDATVARLRKYVLRAKVTIDAGRERFTRMRHRRSDGHGPGKSTHRNRRRQLHPVAWGKPPRTGARA